MRHQIAARVPADTYRTLCALTSLLETSQADVLTQALDALSRSLSPSQRRALRKRKPSGR